MNFENIENLDEVLKGRINGEIVDQVITKLTAAGENYMSLILKVDLKVRNATSGREESVLAVAKLVPPGFVKSGMSFLSQVTFKNELAWYDVVVPIFKEFEEEQDVKGLFTDIYPNFLGGRLSLDPTSDKVDDGALVVLEYLEGYGNAERHIGFDYASTKEVIKALARFHALPVALKLKKPEFFKEKVLPSFATLPDPPKDNNFNPLDGMLDIIKECPECEPFVSRCEEALKHNPFEEKETTYLEPWATAVHNDFWVNNIMLKDDDTSKIKIVDFQMTWYGSFATDLTFFLLLSVQPAVLKQHFDEFVKFYYDVYIDYLKQLKVEDTDQFKYEDYLKELEIKVKTAQYSHALMFTNVLFREKGVGPDTVFDENPDTLKNMMTTRTPKQKERIWEITKFCAEKNWI